ncbi:MAG: hypothetical protein KGH75_00820 [Rhodospirillales bacterium]|nr:hypothetical protein [Rhodospirillales bacterium]
MIATIGVSRPPRFALAGFLRPEGPRVIELSLKAEFGMLERALQRAAADQMPFAVAVSLNDAARAARDRVNREMPEVFDRPTRFTERALVAPKELAARKDRHQAIVTVRPIQAKYLLREELGGTRTAEENTRKAGSALVLPGAALTLDAHGNIAAGTMRKLRAQARRKGAGAGGYPVFFLAADRPGNKAGIGGYFERLSRFRIRRLTAFEARTEYQPRFEYRRRVGKAAMAVWSESFRRRIGEAIATAR